MERVLTFKYPFENITDVNKLKELFINNNIEFICYESKGWYAHVFVVRKSGKKWNELYKMINSIRAAKYEFKKTYIEAVEGKLTEVVYC